MADYMIEIADGFWNIRGSFKIGGVVDIGTQASLVRLASGRYVLLDSYTLTGDVAKEVMDRTDQGSAVDGIINLHPFHTIHVKATAAMFPGAKLYGSERHVAKAPDLPWQQERVDQAAMHALFAQDFDFMVPEGVDFISKNEKLHFSSVLAFHKASKTLHVDDTLMWMNIPFVGGLSFHPTLKSTLERRPGAAQDFRAWAQTLAKRCEDVEHLCAAHMRKPAPGAAGGLSLSEQITKALGKVERVLAAHEKAFS